MNIRIQKQANEWKNECMSVWLKKGLHQFEIIQISHMLYLFQIELLLELKHPVFLDCR